MAIRLVLYLYTPFYDSVFLGARSQERRLLIVLISCEGKGRYLYISSFPAAILPLAFVVYILGQLWPVWSAFCYRAEIQLSGTNQLQRCGKNCIPSLGVGLFVPSPLSTFELLSWLPFFSLSFPLLSGDIPTVVVISPSFCRSEKGPRRAGFVVHSAQ